MKPVVGLTGGIACGKSTVARLLAAKGVAVVDADALSREVVEPGTDGLAAVVEAFGPDVLDARGHLDRAKLGAMVFAEPSRRATLEAILHPRIGALGLQKIAALADSPTPYVVYEAALLVETGRATTFPVLVVVSASADVQRARVAARDGLTPEAVEARLAAQLPLAQKEAAATFVVRNDGSEAELAREVDALHARILERLGLPPQEVA